MNSLCTILSNQPSERTKANGKEPKSSLVEFSSLSKAVFDTSVIARDRQAHPHQELNTKSRFCPISLSLTIQTCNN
jgi:hypothetical protein